MEKFKLKTKLITTVEWQEAKGNKTEREKTEKEFQRIADFINEDLANVIVGAIEKL